MSQLLKQSRLKVQSEEVFEPESDQEQEISQFYKKPRSYIHYESSCSGKWNIDQNIKYVAFMDFYKDIFISKEKRRLTRIFKQMSAFIVTRTSIQCRSHHQKLLEKYGNFKKIVSQTKKSMLLKYQQTYTNLVQFMKDNKGATFNRLKDEVEKVSVETQTEKQTETEHEQFKVKIEEEHFKVMQLNYLRALQFQYQRNFSAFHSFSIQ